MKIRHILAKLDIGLSWRLTFWAHALCMFVNRLRQEPTLRYAQLSVGQWSQDIQDKSHSFDWKLYATEKGKHNDLPLCHRTIETPIIIRPGWLFGDGNSGWSEAMCLRVTKERYQPLCLADITCVLCSLAHEVAKNPRTSTGDVKSVVWDAMIQPQPTTFNASSSNFIQRIRQSVTMFSAI